jgi:hypothetical protein
VAAPPPEGTARAAPPVGPRLAAVRAAVPPVVDGRLDDQVWTTAVGVSDFTQQFPYGGSPPSERTMVKVAYDDDALYIAFDCQQTETPLAYRLTRRDRDSESDWVWVHIDSRRDVRTAFFFAVNISGVLADGTLSDGLVTNFEWDENWQAETAANAGGWSAEMRIPLRVLRFSDSLPVQSWGLWASRYIAMRQEKDDWPYIPRAVAAPVPFFGRLDELRDLRPGGGIELRPFVLGRLARRDPDPMVVSSGTDVGAEAGLDLKLHPTQALTLDAALNPDFAQVEADQLVFNLNNYEVQYPEKRPLFLEGAEALATPLAVFYSRRIGSSPTTPTLRAGSGGATMGEQFVDVPQAATIYGATKLVGRVRDAWTVGLLAALAARNDYRIVPEGGTTPERRTVEPLTAFNVLRARREIGERSHVGAIATATSRFENTDATRVCPGDGMDATPGERCFRDAYVGGLDALWRSPGAEYVASAQVVGSTVKNGRPVDEYDGTTIGSGSKGLGTWLKLAKDGGHNVLADFTYTGLGRQLTYNDLGFMQRQNLHEGRLGFELRSLEPGALTLDRRVRLEVSTRRNRDGLDLGTVAELLGGTKLQGFWNTLLAVGASPARFDDREIGDGSALERAAYLGARFELASDPRRSLFGFAKGETRWLSGGLVAKLESTLALRALPQLEIELVPQLSYERGEPRQTPGRNTYQFGRLLARSFGATLRASYTFTPRLSLQAFAQLFLSSGHYSDFSSAPVMPGSRIRLGDLTPLATPPINADFQQAALNANVVLRWEYRLGSTLFLVYSRSQIPNVPLDPGETAALRLSAVNRVPAVDVILLKLSFWWAT